MTALTPDVESLKTCTRLLMNHVHFVQQSFNLKPDKAHHGACINYVDLKEFRDEFCTELINTVCEWVYNQQKANSLLQTFQEQGRSPQNAMQAFIQQTFKKFRDRDNREIFLQGQFGELLLFNFLQHFFSAVPLLRKMPIKTSLGMEVNGADAIHYALDGSKHLLYLGEAKTYSSKYQFSSAFKDAMESIIHTYDTHLQELSMYIYDDFIDTDLVKIAQEYKNGVLKNVEVHLVSIITYNETKAVTLSSETEIKSQIMKIIAERGKALDKKLFEAIPSHLLPRFNYIIMPIWDMKNLLAEFQKLLGK
jgi:predicted DNA-binding ArsR family transcriptional regulator